MEKMKKLKKKTHTIRCLVSEEVFGRLLEYKLSKGIDMSEVINQLIQDKFATDKQYLEYELATAFRNLETVKFKARMYNLPYEIKEVMSDPYMTAIATIILLKESCGQAGVLVIW